jgi:hypothetical protein
MIGPMSPIFRFLMLPPPLVLVPLPLSYQTGHTLSSGLVSYWLTQLPFRGQVVAPGLAYPDMAGEPPVLGHRDRTVASCAEDAPLKAGDRVLWRGFQTA